MYVIKIHVAENLNIARSLMLTNIYKIPSFHKSEKRAGGPGGPTTFVDQNRKTHVLCGYLASQLLYKTNETCGITL